MESTKPDSRGSWSQEGSDHWARVRALLGLMGVNVYHQDDKVRPFSVVYWNRNLYRKCRSGLKNRIQSSDGRQRARISSRRILYAAISLSEKWLMGQKS